MTRAGIEAAYVNGSRTWVGVSVVQNIPRQMQPLTGASLTTHRRDWDYGVSTPCPGPPTETTVPRFRHPPR
jgi:hypothetical protein